MLRVQSPIVLGDADELSQRIQRLPKSYRECVDTLRSGDFTKCALQIIAAGESANSAADDALLRIKKAETTIQVLERDNVRMAAELQRRGALLDERAAEASALKDTLLQRDGALHDCHARLAALADLSASEDEARRSAAGLREQVKALSDELDAQRRARAALEGVHTDNTALQRRVDELVAQHGRYAALQQRAQALEASLARLAEERGSLRDQVEARDARVADLERYIEDFASCLEQEEATRASLGEKARLEVLFYNTVGISTEDRGVDETASGAAPGATQRSASTRAPMREPVRDPVRPSARLPHAPEPLSPVKRVAPLALRGKAPDRGPRAANPGKGQDLGRGRSTGTILDMEVRSAPQQDGAEVDSSSDGLFSDGLDDPADAASALTARTVIHHALAVGTDTDDLPYNGTCAAGVQADDASTAAYIRELNTQLRDKTRELSRILLGLGLETHARDDGSSLQLSHSGARPAGALSEGLAGSRDAPPGVSLLATAPPSLWEIRYSHVRMREAELEAELQRLDRFNLELVGAIGGTLAGEMRRDEQHLRGLAEQGPGPAAAGGGAGGAAQRAYRITSSSPGLRYAGQQVASLLKVLHGNTDVRETCSLLYAKMARYRSLCHSLAQGYSARGVGGEPLSAELASALDAEGLLPGGLAAPRSRSTDAEAATRKYERDLSSLLTTLMAQRSKIAALAQRVDYLYTQNELLSRQLSVQQKVCLKDLAGCTEETGEALYARVMVAEGLCRIYASMLQKGVSLKCKELTESIVLFNEENRLLISAEVTSALRLAEGGAAARPGGGAPQPASSDACEGVAQAYGLLRACASRMLQGEVDATVCDEVYGLLLADTPANFRNLMASRRTVTGSADADADVGGDAGGDAEGDVGGAGRTAEGAGGRGYTRPGSALFYGRRTVIVEPSPALQDDLQTLFGESKAFAGTTLDEARAEVKAFKARVLCLQSRNRALCEVIIELMSLLEGRTTRLARREPRREAPGPQLQGPPGARGGTEIVLVQYDRSAADELSSIKSRRLLAAAETRIASLEALNTDLSTTFADAVKRLGQRLSTIRFICCRRDRLKAALSMLKRRYDFGVKEHRQRDAQARERVAALEARCGALEADARAREQTAAGMCSACTETDDGAPAHHWRELADARAALQQSAEAAAQLHAEAAALRAENAALQMRLSERDARLAAADTQHAADVVELRQKLAALYELYGQVGSVSKRTLEAFSSHMRHRFEHHGRPDGRPADAAPCAKDSSTSGSGSSILAVSRDGTTLSTDTCECERSVGSAVARLAARLDGVAGKVSALAGLVAERLLAAGAHEQPRAAAADEASQTSLEPPRTPPAAVGASASGPDSGPDGGYAHSPAYDALRERLARAEADLQKATRYMDEYRENQHARAVNTDHRQLAQQETIMRLLHNSKETFCDCAYADDAVQTQDSAPAVLAIGVQTEALGAGASRASAPGQPLQGVPPPEDGCGSAPCADVVIMDDMPAPAPASSPAPARSLPNCRECVRLLALLRLETMEKGLAAKNLRLERDVNAKMSEEFRGVERALHLLTMEHDKLRARYTLLEERHRALEDAQARAPEPPPPDRAQYRSVTTSVSRLEAVASPRTAARDAAGDAAEAVKAVEAAELTVSTLDTPQQTAKPCGPPRSALADLRKKHAIQVFELTKESAALRRRAEELEQLLKAASAEAARLRSQLNASRAECKEKARRVEELTRDLAEAHIRIRTLAADIGQKERELPRRCDTEPGTLQAPRPQAEPPGEHPATSGGAAHPSHIPHIPRIPHIRTDKVQTVYDEIMGGLARSKANIANMVVNTSGEDSSFKGLPPRVPAERAVGNVTESVVERCSTADSILRVATALEQQNWKLTLADSGSPAKEQEGTMDATPEGKTSGLMLDDSDRVYLKQTALNEEDISAILAL